VNKREMEKISDGFLQVLKRSRLLTTCAFRDNRGVKLEANEWSQLSMEEDFHSAMAKTKHP